ncbi:hypothetical protein RF55_15069, partial [Lasius niger]
MTQLFFKCQMCNYEVNIWSEPTEPEILDVNTAAVAGTVTVGIGFAQLKELCAAMNIPSVDNMKMAGEVEKQLTLERKETINGIPHITVVGVRNKFCMICDVAEENGIEPRDHKCYKNFDLNASSTSMESDAIVEGFKNSLEMHEMIYRTVIADGDSSVYQTISALLLKFTNDSAESFNSIICREIGGKRINFGNRGSYNARIAGAVVQYNTQQVLT